jgi:hypothetical protein
LDRRSMRERAMVFNSRTRGPLLHLPIAYYILRHLGVAIGKRDYPSQADHLAGELD